MRVEVGGQVLQIAAAEVVGEGNKSVELILGQLFGEVRNVSSVLGRAWISRSGRRKGNPKKMAGGFAYCHGDVMIHASDEFSGVLMKEVIPGRS